MTVPRYRPEFARPDLPIPLVPAGPVATVFRKAILGSHGPEFARVRARTARWAAALLLAAALPPAVRPELRGVAGAAYALLLAYVAVRMLTVGLYERRQHAFEPEWLAAETAALRAHSFEVLRLAVRAVGERARVYDLTRAEDVARLLRRCRDEPSAQAVVEFAYQPAPGADWGVTRVRRELAELVLVRPGRHPGAATIRFPEARYVGRPAPGERGSPSRTTHWVLSGPVRIAVGTDIPPGADA